MKSESQKHAEKKVNKTKKKRQRRNTRKLRILFRNVSHVFIPFLGFFFFFVSLNFCSRVFVFFRIQCNLHGFSVFFICLFHFHFSPDMFHLFRLVFTFLSLCLRISCVLLFVRLLFFQCCSLCFWTDIFSFALSVLFFPRFLKHILLELRIRATWRT